MKRDSEHLFYSRNLKALATRWRAVARKTGLRLETLINWDGLPVFVLETSAAKKHPDKTIYFSAGIHGDEPAGVLGLLRWAEENTEQLRKLPALIFPWLNPWGLQENSRRDASGNDLNRVWDEDGHPLTGAVKQRLGKRKLQLALLLHEDYEAQGVYLYEPISYGIRAWSDVLLKTVSDVIAIDPRTIIDGNRTTAKGIIRRRFTRKKPLWQEPEALYLCYNRTDRAYTFETPSEFQLAQRVEAQRCLINKAIELL